MIAIVPVITDLGNGTYAIDPLDLWMDRSWRVRITRSTEALGEDEAAFHVCIESMDSVRCACQSPPANSEEPMSYARTLWMAATLACAGCPGDDGDDQGDEHSHEEAGHTTSGGTTESGGTTTSNVTSTDDGTTSSGSTSGSDGHGTTEHHDSTGHDTASTGHGTGGKLCDEIASGCHDMGKEIEMCHEIGHEGDEMVCAEVYEMCQKVCGF